MTIEYLKKATPPQDAIDNATSEAVERILADIQINGRDAVDKYARDTDDDDVVAQAILMSGCYMMNDQHLSKPSSDVFERWKYLTPNFSMRLSNLAAALLRPQIAQLAEGGRRWNHIYATLERELTKPNASRSHPAIMPKRSLSPVLFNSL